MNNGNNTNQTDKYLAHLHHNAKPFTHENAKELRQRETEAERKLWALLRNRQLKGKKFRRQHAIDKYVADFYCHESKLVIEPDGNFHKGIEAKEYDNARTTLLNETGIIVLRFWNHEVLDNPEKVLQQISEHLH